MRIFHLLAAVILASGLFIPPVYVGAQSGSGACPVQFLQKGGIDVDLSSDPVVVKVTLFDSKNECPSARLTFSFVYSANGKSFEKTVTDSSDGEKFEATSRVSLSDISSKLGNVSSVSVETSVSNSSGEKFETGSQSFEVSLTSSGGNDKPTDGQGGPTEKEPPVKTGGTTDNPDGGGKVGGGKTGSSGDSSLDNPIGYNSLVDLFFAVMRYMLLVIGALTVAVIIYGGFQMVLSRGNESAITEAKRTLTYAIAGLLVAVLAFSIVGIIQNIIGVK